MERMWRAPRLSGPDLNYLLWLVVGLATLPVGVDHLLFPTTGLARGPAARLAAVGAFLVVAGIVCWRLPARRIELSSDGTLTFLSSRGRLEVRPGGLKSVRRFPNDPGRLFPFLVRAESGRILLACRFGETEALQEALRAHSPDARVARLVRRLRSERKAPRRSCTEPCACPRAALFTGAGTRMVTRPAVGCLRLESGGRGARRSRRLARARFGERPSAATTSQLGPRSRGCAPCKQCARKPRDGSMAAGGLGKHQRRPVSVPGLPRTALARWATVPDWPPKPPTAESTRGGARAPGRAADRSRPDPAGAQ